MEKKTFKLNVTLTKNYKLQSNIKNIQYNDQQVNLDKITSITIFL